MLGKLQNFSSRFDLKKYQELRKSIIINVLLHYKYNHFLREIYELMKQVDYNLPLSYKIEILYQRVVKQLLDKRVIKYIYQRFRTSN
jgi:hypothetical protein